MRAQNGIQCNSSSPGCERPPPRTVLSCIAHRSPQCRENPKQRLECVTNTNTPYRAKAASQADEWQNSTADVGGLGMGTAQRGLQGGDPNLPGVNPEDALLQVVHGEPVGPPPRARLLVDGASARTAHGGGLDTGQAGIPIRPEKDPMGTAGQRLVGMQQHRAPPAVSRRVSCSHP